MTITHSGNGSASVYTNATGSTAFTVTNTGTTGTALFSVTDCTGTISNCSVSPAASYLQSGWSTGVTVSFTGGMTPGTGSFTLKAHDQSNNSLMATYTVSVTVTADPNAPTLSLTPHLGDRRDVGMCVADCFESTLSYTLPAYTSLDVPRSVTMLYRSGSAYPHGKLSLDASSANAPAGSKFRLQLQDQNGANVLFTNGQQALFFTRNTSGPTRIVAQFDATQIPTSARMYTAYVSTIRTDGTVFGTTVAPVRIIVINDRNSPFGAGVTLVGVQHIWFNQPDGALVTDGSGSATFFAGSCNVNTTCSYTSPSGEFSNLTTAGAAYYRTYPDGTRLQFYPDGNQYSIADRFGSTTVVSYQYNGSYSSYVPIAITDPAGQSITFQYRNVDWLYGWKQGSLGNVQTPMGDAPIGIDNSNNARHWVELGGGTYRWRMTYGAQNLLDTAFTKDSSVFKHVYRYGATLGYTDAPSIKTDDGNPYSPRVALRNAADTLLERAAAGKGTSAELLAVATDLRARLIGPLGDTTFLSLSRFGSPSKIVAPGIPADSNEYDPNTGQLTRNISPTGAVTRFTWVADQLRQTIDSGTRKTVNITYENKYSLPKRIYGDVQEQWFTYDTTKTGWPLLTSRIGSSTATPTTYQFDSYGRPTSITDPSPNHTTSYGYQTSGLRNRTSVTAPNGQTTTFAKDAWGRDTSVTNPYGRTSKQKYDILNRPTIVVNAVGDTTRFQYDLLNRLTVVTDPKNQVYTMQRNRLGWIVAQIDPGSRVDSMWYDIAGRMVRTKTRGGRHVRLQYDSLSRVTMKRSLTGGDSVKYAYGLQGRSVVASVFSGTTLVSVDSIVTDSAGRTVREWTSRPGVGTWRSNSWYDAAHPGRTSVVLFKIPTSGTPTTEAQVDFTYNAEKRLESIQTPNFTSTLGYGYDGLPTTATLSPSLSETSAYTLSHAPSSRSYNVSAVDAALYRWYRTDSLSRVAERGGAGAQFQTFTYDSSDRLKTWAKKTRTNTPSCTNTDGYGYTCNGTIATTDQLTSMAYDKSGNPTDLGAAVQAGNRLTSFDGYNMTYDGDGNMLTRVGPGVSDTYVWDDFGQLKSVTRSGISPSTTFSYDGFGRRIRKTSVAGTIHYIWDGDQIIAEVDQNGAMLQSYTYRPGIDQPHSVTAGGATYFTSIGPGGDVNGLIRRSDNAVVAQYAYTPWGKLDGADQPNVGTTRVNSLRWRGLVRDDETGLYQVRARYYSPTLRRFISEDPSGLSAGINQFAYGGNDPINFSDPTGLDRCYITYETRTESGVLLGTYRESVPCPQEGSSISDSPWGDPTIPITSISTVTVAHDGQDRPCSKRRC